MNANSMDDLVASRLLPLQSKPFNELFVLAPYQGEKVNRDGKKFTVSIWKDAISDLEIRVVVQVYRYLFFGLGRMTADGFRIEKDGTLKKLSREELYDFS